MSNVLINGREYEFADVSVVLEGKDILGIRGIKYTEKQEKEVLYGKGNKPMTIQHGNISYDGELSITQSEVIALKEYARTITGKASILGVKLNAVVCYGNPAEGAMITDRISGIEFTESPSELGQGDKNMEITLPFIAKDIECNC